MVINTNTAAIRGARMLGESTDRLNSALARLASGSKIVSPQDDAAGLAVASKFDAQIQRNKGVQNNLTSALSYSQTQDGFLQKVGNQLGKVEFGWKKLKSSRKCPEKLKILGESKAGPQRSLFCAPDFQFSRFLKGNSCNFPTFCGFPPAKLKKVEK